MKRDWDKITLLSKASHLHLYKILDKKYYIIGNQSNDLSCNIQCDELNKYPTGSSCTTIEALLDNWLKYNNSYKIKTNFYLDIFNNTLINHFKLASQSCFHRSKCPLYPNVNVFITKPQQKLQEFLIQSTMINEEMIDELIIVTSNLIYYYEQVGNYLFKNEPIKIPELKLSKDIDQLWTSQHIIPKFNYLNQNTKMNQNIKFYGNVLYSDYIEQIYTNYNDMIKSIDLMYQMDEFMDKYILLIMPLFFLLNDLEIMSQMFSSEYDTQIVFTEMDDVTHFTVFFENFLKIKDNINIIDENNCLSITSQQIPADEYRWSVFKSGLTSKPTKIDYIKNFNLSLRPQRAGVIIYTIVNNVYYFGFGVDSEYGELTDFGGHVNYGKDKNAINGALREFREESLIFNYQYKDLLNELIIYDDKNAVLFINVNQSPESITEQFHKKLKMAKKPEVNDIKWLSLDELKIQLNKSHGLIYNRVKTVLFNAGDFYKYL